MVHNVAPLQMIVLVDVPKIRVNNADFKKNKTTKKLSPFYKDTFVHAHVDKPVDYMNNDNGANDVDTIPIKNIIDYAETNIDPNVEPPTEPITKSTIDIPIFDMYLNDILN